MSTQNEEAKVRITLDIEESNKRLKELQAQMEKLRQSIKGTSDKGEKSALRKELEATQAEFKKTKQELGQRLDVIIDGKAAGASLNDLERAARKLKAELRSINPDTDEFRKGSSRLRELRTNIDDLNKTLQPTKPLFAGFRQEFLAFGSVAAGVLGFQFITSQISGIIRKVYDLSDSLANVMKTTGLTGAEAQKLNEELGNIDTRTSRKELLSLASDAGKLGKDSVEDIKKFVEEADKIKVALGEDLGQNAVTEIAKISDLFGEGMLNIASAINTVGQSSAATEAYQVDFLGRMAGIAVQSKITASEIQGYGAALELSKVQSETASTALAQFFIEFQRDTEKFGAAAGFAAGELKKIISDKGVNAGFLEFLTNLKASSKGTDDLLKRLQSLGIDGARGAQTFLALTNNIKLVTQQQQLANKAMIEGTSVIKEFNTRNDDFAGKIDRIQKSLYSFVTNNSIVTGFKRLIGFISDLTATKLSDTLQDERLELNKLQIQIESANTSQEDRVKLINELKKQYPDLLKNINAETVSNQDLAKSIAQVNTQLINKRVIQLKQEEIDESNKKAAETLNRRLKLEDQIREQIVIIREKYPDFKIIGDNEIEQLQSLNKQAENQTFVYKGAGSAFEKSRIMLVEYNRISKEFDKTQDQSNVLTREKTALMKQLGIAIEEVKTKESSVTNETVVDTTTTTTNTTGAPDPDAVKKAAAKAYQNLQEYAAKIRQLRVDLIDDELQHNEAAEELRYYNEVTALQKIGATTKEQKAAQDTALQLAEQEHQQKMAQIRSEWIAKQEKETQKQLDEALKTYDKFGEAVGAVLGDVTNKLAKPFVVKLKVDVDDWQDQLQKAAFYLNEFGRAANAVFSGIAEIKNNKDQTAFNAEKQRIDKEKEIFQAQLDHKLISREQYDDKVKHLDSELDRKNKEMQLKAFQRSQNAALAEAIINGALAVINALATVHPYPAAVVAAVSAGVAAGVEIAVIESQPPPQFETGTKLEKDQLHVVDGPSHAQGGIDLVDTTTGKTIGNMEGSEGLYILSKNTTEQSKEILNRALSYSQTRTTVSENQKKEWIETTSVPPNAEAGAGAAPPAVPPSPPGEGRGEDTDSKALINKSNTKTNAIYETGEQLDKQGNPVDSKALINAMPPPPPNTDSKALINRSDTGFSPIGKASKPLINATDTSAPTVPLQGLGVAVPSINWQHPITQPISTTIDFNRVQQAIRYERTGAQAPLQASAPPTQSGFTPTLKGDGLPASTVPLQGLGVAVTDLQKLIEKLHKRLDEPIKSEMSWREYKIFNNKARKAEGKQQYY